MSNPNGNPNIVKTAIKKGEVRNPKGNNGNFKLTTLINKILEEEPIPGKTNAELIVDSIIKECKRGNPVLIKELWSRLEGAVKTDLNVTSDSGLGVVILPQKDIKPSEESND